MYTFMQRTKKQLITTRTVRRRVCVRASVHWVLFDNIITVLLSSPEKTCIIIWRKTTRGARILYASIYHTYIYIIYIIWAMERARERDARNNVQCRLREFQ